MKRRVGRFGCIAAFVTLTIMVGSSAAADSYYFRNSGSFTGPKAPAAPLSLNEIPDIRADVGFPVSAQLPQWNDMGEAFSSE